MGKMRRYKISKIIYPSSVVLLKVSGGYCSYENDSKILDFIKFRGYFDVFDKYKINYILLDDLEIIKERNEDENNYERYLLAAIIEKFLLNYKKIINDKYRSLYE